MGLSRCVPWAAPLIQLTDMYNPTLDQITSSSANFETVLSLLSSFFVPEDDDTFLSWIEMTLGDKRLRSNMSKWRLNWQELVKTGREGTALL